MKQVSASVEDKIYEQIEELSKKQKRSISSTVNLLIAQAIKEKNRKRCRKEDIPI
jgi:hypothetical protein